MTIDYEVQDASRTFVASDHHFGAYRKEGRFAVILGDDYFSAEEEAELVEKWNATVGPDDPVLYVGDFDDCRTADGAMEYRKRLNGRIILLRGNHDVHDETVSGLYEDMFQGVCDKMTIKGLNMVLMHAPRRFSQKERTVGVRKIYGHLHRACDPRPEMDIDSFCSCVRWNDGYPVSLGRVLEGMATVQKMELEQIDEMLNEWHTPEAQRLLEKMGVSERNWRIFARRLGRADGQTWTFEMLANEENISRPRVYQIFRRTQAILAARQRR